MKRYTQPIFDALKDPKQRKLYSELVPIFEIFETLTQARIKKDLTQKELAEKIGIAQSSLARLESGRANPTLIQLIKMANALDLRVQLVPA